MSAVANLMASKYRKLGLLLYKIMHEYMFVSVTSLPSFFVVGDWG
jgi:hypothetical protein